MTQFDFRQLLRRYQTGRATDEEIRRIEAWYESMGAGTEQSLNSLESEAVRQRMWTHIQAETEQRTLTPTTIVLPLYRQSWFRIAASVVLLLGLFGYGFWQWSTERPAQVELLSVRMNNTTRPMLIRLDDGSQVSLEPGSFLRFPDHFPKTKREVFLTGEAFFSVNRQPERPFLVVTDRLVTRVLGTSFRVKAFGGKANVSVTVRTGKVSVFSRPSANASDKEFTNAVVLTPNQRAVFYPSDARLVKTLAENPVLLTSDNKRPDFNFVDTPLPVVFDSLEKAYGVDFVYDTDALAHCTLTARLTSESLYEKLTLISEVTHARHEIIDGQVVIDSRGCTPATRPIASKPLPD
ncbi:FecR family protein [Spirosoma sp. KUDC1026]|uniref:FecR family protein n=1 Tax=Spirosoma sp. KUDC1026 TaxID=2745947 RepID=UPI00159B9A40|nr:FecR family protein [Spirosoma sp. KUDC1026]QKZ12791.1 FecR domain-containing protein [Spirosoma sp. KUDC1026]